MAQILNTADAVDLIPDLQVFGNPDMLKLLCKTSSEERGFSKSLKGLEVRGIGVVLISITEHDGQVAESMGLIPRACVIDVKNSDGVIVGREIELASQFDDSKCDPA